LRSSRQTIQTFRLPRYGSSRRKKGGDGFEDFHYDYGSSNGGFNAISSTINVNIGVCHSEDEEEKNKKEAGNADEENDDDENGQVEDSNEAMNEQAHGYLPEPLMEVEGLVEGCNEAMNEQLHGYLPGPLMEVEGMEETMNEGQIILLGEDIEGEDKAEDEEAEASNDESVKVESVVFTASNSPDQPERTMLAKKINVSIGNSLLKKRTKSM
jgi:hypothetical protein